MFPRFSSPLKPGRTIRALVTCLSVTAASWAHGGCGSSSKVIAPNLGTIEVTALVEGSGVLPDTLLVLLDMAPSGPVAANGVFFIPYLPQGDYVVALLEELENCNYGVNARTVTVVPEEVSPTTFLVRCQ